MPNPARLAALLLATAAATAPAAEPGFLGIATYVDSEGLVLNPVVRTITVTRVVPHSPAAKAGIGFDDQLLEIDGKVVRGSRASDLRPLLDKRAGQSLTLLVKKKSGQTVSYTVVLAERPPQ